MKKPYVRKIVLRRMLDEDPDLSFLTQYENYTGTDMTPEDVAKYAEQDQKRLDAYNRGAWYMMGIRAEAEILLPAPFYDGKGKQHWKIETISSGGLWGIESDSEKSCKQGIEQEQISELKYFLKQLHVRIPRNVPIERKDL